MKRHEILTIGIPIIFRKIPDPKYIAAASKRPIPMDNTSAVETEGRTNLSSV